jgi:hypothetical protein
VLELGFSVQKEAKHVFCSRYKYHQKRVEITGKKNFVTIIKGALSAKIEIFCYPKNYQI